MPGGIIATGWYSASQRSASRLFARNCLLPFGQHDATINSQTAKLAFAVRSVEMDMEQDFVVFPNVEAEALPPFSAAHGMSFATFHLP